MTDSARLVFSRHGRRSERLADLVEGTGHAPNVAVYAAYASWSLLLDPHATVYCGVTSSLIEAPTPVAETTPPPPRDEGEAVAFLREALERAVLASMGDAKRVAVSTGGGLDSGVLLALAVHVGRRAGKEVCAIALDYGGAGDDRPYLADLERHLDCEVIRVPPESGADHVGLLDGVDAAPFYCPTGPMEVALLRRAKAAGATRVLTGAGGDQLFDGRPTDLSRFARRGRVVEGVRRARSMRGFDRPRSPVFTWLARPLLAGLVPASMRARRAARGAAHLPSWAGARMKELEEERRRQTVAVLAACLPETRPLDERIFTAQRVQFAWLRHQETLASGMRRVDAYLDPALVRAVRAIPRELLLHGEIRRGLFRAAARDLIPAALFAREDKASAEPALVRFLAAAGGEELFRSYQSVDVLTAMGVVDPGRFGKAYQSFVQHPAKADGWLGPWCVLALERFARSS